MHSNKIRSVLSTSFNHHHYIYIYIYIYICFWQFIPPLELELSYVYLNEPVSLSNILKFSKCLRLWLSLVSHVATLLLSELRIDCTNFLIQRKTINIWGSKPVLIIGEIVIDHFIWIFSVKEYRLTCKRS